MRLEKIKLSGFKSFVEPTTIPLPVNLVGIVGPNGCGKSNIIDAVRWVMGESSAKNLRGGSMADVIFNGSSSRKPIGKASVELIFDNDDGTIGGEYSKYSQLSIKRQVTRDGQSTYLLNGTKCRRRDITDIFLGTGLGPRSYAIIEQGMISRLIEAKPEELRVFLEEAAGVSKYKERRHETEIRMRHTGENLERLNDLREELGKQLEKLKRQAKAAETYKRLKADERRYKCELLALHWKNFDEQLQVQNLETLQYESELEKMITEQQRLDISTEKARSYYKTCQLNVDGVQANFYELGAEIARVEQNISHAKSLHKQAEQELFRASKEQSRYISSIDQDKKQLTEFHQEKIKIKAKKAETTAKELLAISHQDKTNSRNHVWQSEWEQFINLASEPKEQLKTHQARLRFLEQQQQQLLKRQQRLKQESEQLKDEGVCESLERSQIEIDQLDKQSKQMQRQLDQFDEDITAARELNQQLNQEISQSRTELQSASGRIAALEKIVEHATGRDRLELAKWLEEQGLNGAPRLIELIEVENGWENAVEMVLSEFLEAICVKTPKPFLGQLNGLLNEGVAIIDKAVPVTIAPSNHQRLLCKVKSPWPLGGLLGTILCAESLDDAYLRVSQLKDGESIITIDGIWMGRGWLIKGGQRSAKSGLLQKEKELKQLRKKEVQLVKVTDEGNQALQISLSQLQALENDRVSLRSKQNQNLNLLTSKKSKQAGLVAHFEQNRGRREKIQQELEEINLEEADTTQKQKISLAQIEETELKTAGFDDDRVCLITQRDELKSEQESANQHVRELRDAIHSLTSRFDSLKAAENFTIKNIERAEAQLKQVEQRIAEIKPPGDESEIIIANQETEHRSMMQKKMSVEEALQQARRELSIIENSIRENSEKRAHLELAINRKREALEKARISQEGRIVHRETVVQQLKEQGTTPQVVIGTMVESANTLEWQEQIERLSGKIGRLGTINLVAIEEHEALSERMTYLGEQHDDLAQSLTMLEQAISKIDQETKALFKETFEKVNAGFQQRFPKLFGGGRAYLSLDDRDLLSTGVSVMASPPGKRNSSIQLLSGGEKALTAVALVFSIFDLNPAPFCLLDEVDAPLDDANVTRFSELVKEMSSSVQFLFISHNKATMEIAQHLAGVTMSEPGISRMVSVDIDEAVKLAEL